MAKFNLISLNSGRIVKVIIANDYRHAEEIAWNSYGLDDYMLESPEETQKQRELQSRWWNLQTLGE